MGSRARLHTCSCMRQGVERRCLLSVLQSASVAAAPCILAAHHRIHLQARWLDGAAHLNRCALNCSPRAGAGAVRVTGDPSHPSSLCGCFIRGGVSIVRRQLNR
jgi:hypothetical protein